MWWPLYSVRIPGFRNMCGDRRDSACLSPDPNAFAEACQTGSEHDRSFSASFRPYCKAENPVGVKKLLATCALIGPSFSLSAFASTHSGSAKKAFHFFSRSARESQASM